MGALGTREGAGLAFLQSLKLGQQECIEYPHGRFSTGYGRVRHNGRIRPAHVVSYEMHIASIPAGFDLRVDTHQANMADCLLHGTDTRCERNGRAKLNSAAVSAIRQRVANGAIQRSLAVEFGVSPQTINHIMRGRTWADEIRLVQD